MELIPLRLLYLLESGRALLVGVGKVRVAIVARCDRRHRLRTKPPLRRRFGGVVRWWSGEVVGW